jgi:hypothetical protein
MLIAIMDVHYVQKVMFPVVSTKCHSSGGSHLPGLAEVHIQFRGFFLCSLLWSVALGKVLL